MSGKKNPYRTTGKAEKLNEPVRSPPAPARKFTRHYASKPGLMATVGGTKMSTDEMEFGTEEDLSTNIGRTLSHQPDPEIAGMPEPEDEPEAEFKPEADEKAASASGAQQPGSVSGPAPVHSSQQRGQTGVTAVLIDPDEEERRIEERLEEERKDIPMAEPVPEKPWYKRQSTICFGFIILLIIIVVAIAVPLTNQTSGGGAPAPPPTISPAPTALAAITVVIQLDAKPWETGWSLVCDEETIIDVPAGTYALVTGRDNFRVQYTTEVTVGADCQFSIVDTGDDGIDPGFYALYNGPRAGNQADLITGGNVAGAGITSTFTPGFSPSIVPTAAPTLAGNTTPAACTVCPDGTPVPFKNATAEGWGTLTCEELDFLAGVTTNPAVCRNMQDAAASGCGCRNFCTTPCPDRVSDIDPDLANQTVFFQFDQAVTCQDLQTQIETNRANSEDQCLAANFLGEDACGCPNIAGPFCRICEPTGGNPSTNPPEGGLLTEIVPGVSCLDITGIAYTLKRDDPRTGFFQLCPACLAIGAYCGCGIPDDGRPWCRLCGGSADLLPEPSRMVNSSLLGHPTTCYHIEFLSNINDNSTLACDTYREDAAAVCCTA